MSEIGLTYISGAKLLILAIIGFLYSLAGGGAHISRRVTLPLILCLSWGVNALLVYYISLRLILSIVLTIPLAWIVYSIFSYGEGSWLRKLIGRVGQQFAVGAIHGLSLSILPCLYLKEYGLLTLGVIIPSLTLGFLGGLFYSDLPAAWKEAVTGVSEYLIPMFVL